MSTHILCDCDCESIPCRSAQCLSHALEYEHVGAQCQYAQRSTYSMYNLGLEESEYVTASI